MSKWKYFNFLMYWLRCVLSAVMATNGRCEIQWDPNTKAPNDWEHNLKVQKVNDDWRATGMKYYLSAKCRAKYLKAKYQYLFVLFIFPRLFWFFFVLSVSLITSIVSLDISNFDSIGTAVLPPRLYFQCISNFTTGTCKSILTELTHEFWHLVNLANR